MKVRLEIVLALCLVWAVCRLSAQPSAPTSSGLGYSKFVDFPISPFTGTFSYSVPIATVTSGSLSLPVTIDYHSAGNKVGDPASNIGLGWNLNYGGSITRTIKGVKDEIPDRGYWYDPTPNTTSANFLHVVNGEIDGEPDIFTWVAGGQGGKFYFDRNRNVVHITKTDAMVVRLGGSQVFNLGFKIILADGTEYFFTNGHFQAASGQFNDLVGFTISKIRSYDGKDSILINCEASSLDEIYKFKYVASPIYYGTSPSNLDVKNDTDVEYILRQNRIKEIIGTNNKITFTMATREDLQPHNSSTNWPTRVSEIKYEDGSNCIKYVLTHEYFKAVPNAGGADLKRLKFKKVQKINCTNVSISEPPIEFEYYGNTLSDNSQFFPAYLDRNIDHYGFYNYNTVKNNVSLTDLIENTTVVNGSQSYNLGTGNRSPNLNATLNGMLKKSRYLLRGLSIIHMNKINISDLHLRKQPSIFLALVIIPQYLKP